MLRIQNDKDIEELYGKKIFDLSFSSFVTPGTGRAVAGDDEDGGTHDTESKNSEGEQIEERVSNHGSDELKDIDDEEDII